MGVPDAAAAAAEVAAVPAPTPDAVDEPDVLLLRVASLLAARTPLANRRSSRNKLNVWQDIKHLINDSRLELEAVLLCRNVAAGLCAVCAGGPS